MTTKENVTATQAKPTCCQYAAENSLFLEIGMSKSDSPDYSIERLLNFEFVSEF